MLIEMSIEGQSRVSTNTQPQIPLVRMIQYVHVVKEKMILLGIKCCMIHYLAFQVKIDNILNEKVWTSNQELLFSTIIGND